MWFGAGFPEQDHGPEHGVLLQADAQFEPAATFCHALDQQALYPGPRIVLTHPVQNGVRRLCHLGRSAQVQHDAVYLRFVGNIRGA
ncbi:hypothetical protein D3C79_700260 [compost metagenome]